MNETPNMFEIANTKVLFVGIILLVGAVVVRTLIEGKGWWRVFFLGGIKKNSADAVSTADILETK